MIYFFLCSSFSFQQNYSGQGGGSGNGGGGGDEDYEIPPITPPNHPEPPLLHPESGYLCHSLPHNGLINPYSYPELPALMMSNMLAQDGHLLSSQMPSVSVHRRVLAGGVGVGGHKRTNQDWTNDLISSYISPY